MIGKISKSKPPSMPVKSRPQRDREKIKLINNCLDKDQVVSALRLSRQIEDPSLRYKTQMEKLVDPFLYNDNAGIASELLSDDCVVFARSRPRAERLTLLARIAFKLSKINGNTEELTAQIHATLLQMAVVFTEDYKELTEQKVDALVGQISLEWGNFSLTKYHDRLVRLLKTYR
ncbi:MAG: hypothetical protein KKC80_02335 [Candidatus Margulisbacteria bacterium]|nr:hypothetical protein [Candidatus Margulisiibacteriota bacterium]MBU1617313.1 hypothetical protein [Candidatus Margulisiibacteriota bacterium]MBU1866913.1 hypothetical protein [Candidatus Margulisiibacteriota bacterium]